MQQCSRMRARPWPRTRRRRRHSRSTINDLSGERRAPIENSGRRDRNPARTTSAIFKPTFSHTNSQGEGSQARPIPWSIHIGIFG